MEIPDLLSEFNGVLDLEQLLFRGAIAVALVALGIFLGKVSTIGLKKLALRLELSKKIRSSFIDLFIAVIRWSIYIIFIVLALTQLKLAGLTDIITSVLVVIPALTGALIVLAIGFSISFYLKSAIEESKISGWKILSQTFFYFILYVFLIYSLKLALISIDPFTASVILMIFTAGVAVSATYLILKNEIKPEQP